MVEETSLKAEGDVNDIVLEVAETVEAMRGWREIYFHLRNILSLACSIAPINRGKECYSGGRHYPYGGSEQGRGGRGDYEHQSHKSIAVQSPPSFPSPQPQSYPSAPNSPPKEPCHMLRVLFLFPDSRLPQTIGAIPSINSHRKGHRAYQCLTRAPVIPANPDKLPGWKKAGTLRVSIRNRGNSLETPNVWVLSSFHPKVWKQPPPPQCLGFVLFSPRRFYRAELAATWMPRQQLTGRGTHVAAMSA